VGGGSNVMKRIFAIIIVLCLFSTGLLVVLDTPDVELERIGLPKTRATLIVGPGQTHTTITSALGVANDGDTIRVYAGTYNERFSISDRVKIIGNGSENTIVNGGGGGHVITSFTDNVELHNMTVRGSGTLFGDYRYGIQIRSSKTLVRNCTIVDNDIGICIKESESNCIIENCTFLYNVKYGVEISTANNNSVVNSTFNTSNSGLRDYGNDNLIKNCSAIYCRPGFTLYGQRSKIENCDLLFAYIIIDGEWIKVVNSTLNKSYSGISIQNSQYITLSNNTFIGTGVKFYGYYKKYWNTHNISTNNTVNGKTLLYLKNEEGKVYNSSYGQVILTNTNYTVIENMNLSNTIHGVTLGFSRYNSIKNVTCDNNIISGIYLFTSDRNRVHNGTCDKNEVGIHLNRGDYNVFENLSGIDNDEYGFQLTDSNDYTNHNYLSNCTFTENRCGIYLEDFDGVTSDADDTTITNTNCSSNHDYGALLEGSRGNRFIGCVFDENDYGGYLDLESGGVSFINCSAWNNSVDGFYVDRDSRGTYFYNVTATNNQDNGIFLDWTRWTDIIECNISNNAGYGIYGISYTLQPCYSLVEKVTANNNGKSGIYFTGPDRAYFQYLNVHNNGWSGFETFGAEDSYVRFVDSRFNGDNGILSNRSNNVKISNCTIVSNTNIGINLTESYDTSVIDNFVQDNDGLGIYVGDYPFGPFGYNEVYHNTFINNNGSGVQGGDEGGITGLIGLGRISIRMELSIIHITSRVL
jgi:parallel beta-helix repeat protein